MQAITVNEHSPSKPPDGMTVAECRDEGFRSLFFFTHDILGYDKFVHRVHGPICQKLQNINIPRLNLTMPRKHFKSTLASESYPLWRATGNPNITMLLAMNTVDNAKLKLGEIQAHVMRNQLYNACYPEVIPNFNKGWAAESCSMRRTAITGTPTFSVAGVITNVISRAVDEIILDDLLTAKQGEGEGDAILPSVEAIQQAIRWMKGSISLLKDPMFGRIINIGTRWAQKDLVEWVISNLPKFAANTFEIKAVIGEWGTPECKPIMPEVYPMESLQELYDTQGETIFRLWYLNEPIDPSEIVFNLDEDNFYNPADMPKDWANGLRKYTAVDLAWTDKERADNNSIITIGVDEHNIKYVLDVQYGKWDALETIERLFSVYTRLEPLVIGVETTAAQELFRQVLPHFMKKYGVALPIRPIKRGGGPAKEVRIITGLQPWVQNKMLKLPLGDQAQPIVVEMRDFRMSKKRRGHDDALDALADAVQMSQKMYVADPPAERHVLSSEEWDAAMADFFSLDKTIDRLEADANSNEFFCNPDQFSYMRN